MFPSIWLFKIHISSRLLSVPNDGGKPPEISVSPIHSPRRLLRLPTSPGMLPVIGLSSTIRTVRLGKSPISGGRVPVRLLLRKTMFSTVVSGTSQITPYQVADILWRTNWWQGSSYCRWCWRRSRLVLRTPIAAHP